MPAADDSTIDSVVRRFMPYDIVSRFLPGSFIATEFPEIHPIISSFLQRQYVISGPENVFAL